MLDMPTTSTHRPATSVFAAHACQVTTRSSTTYQALRVERVALTAAAAPVGHTEPVHPLVAPAMPRVYAAIEDLNRAIVNGQESQSAGSSIGETWADFFSQQRLAEEFDELWLGRAFDGGLVGYAAVCSGPLQSAELGLITISVAHRGQGLAKELIGAILGAHPILRLYVGERNLRAQSLYLSFAEQGCAVRQTGAKYYDNGERALGMVIEKR